MRVFVPIRQFTTSVSGSIKRRAHCEKCGGDYVYELSRHVSGTARVGPRTDNDDAREGSRHRAARNLDKTLREAIEPVPCPQCGWLQSSMVKDLKKHHHRWMNKLGLVLAIVGGGIALLLGMFLSNPYVDPSVHFLVAFATGVCLIGVGLVPLRMVLARKLDPNANHAARAGQSSEAVVVQAGAARVSSARGRNGQGER